MKFWRSMLVFLTGAKKKPELEEEAGERWYAIDEDELDDKLQTNTENGLTDQEAEKRLVEYGKNVLPDKKKRTIFHRLLDQLKDPTILVLIAAALISFLIGERNNGVIILVIVVVNMVVGLVQEQRAENSIDAIRSMTQPQAQVVRDGEQKEIPVSDLVRGDLVVLEAGDYVPADIRIIEEHDLEIDEASLTGESLPVEKMDDELPDESISLGDRVNMAFMNTVVTNGRAMGVVVETGKDTQMGHIAHLLQTTTEGKTPLMKKLGQLSRMLAIFSLSVCVIIFVIGIIQGLPLYDVALNAFSLAIAAIPEGLPAIVTVSLALGMQEMAKENAIMRNLPAVETSGSATVICSDKTGTLTQNKMTVTQVYCNGESLPATALKLDDPTAYKLIHYGILCNDTIVQRDDDNDYSFLGDPTEVALINLGIERGEEPEKVIEELERVEEIPFDSERKLMTTVNEIDDELISITKGAPDVLISLCNYIEIDGKISRMTKRQKEELLAKVDSYSDQALRVLAIGYKELELDTFDEYAEDFLEEQGEEPLPDGEMTEEQEDAAEDAFEEELEEELEDAESDLIFVGLYGMIDPPRKEVIRSIEQAKGAGIRTVMITGDHERTAAAIAKELGIAQDESQVMDGKTLDTLSDEELQAEIENYSTFARVSPEHKLRVVSALQANDEIVVMTGDGVNDAPALKKANIGVAMGITGTEVAKGAADMILADDDFETIVSGIRSGRVVYDNILKAVQFLLSGNIGEIVAILIASILSPLVIGQPIMILTSIQILWINLVSDSLLAIALSMEKAEPDIMTRKPRSPKESIFANGLGVRVAYQGIMIGVLTFAVYVIGFYWGQSTENSVQLGNTMAFMVLGFIQFFHVFNTRSSHNSIFKIGVFSNKMLNLAFIFNIILQSMCMFVPVLRVNLFNMTFLNVEQWGVVLGISILPVIITEIEKAISNHVRKNKQEKQLYQ